MVLRPIEQEWIPMHVFFFHSHFWIKILYVVSGEYSQSYTSCAVAVKEAEKVLFPPILGRHRQMIWEIPTKDVLSKVLGSQKPGTFPLVISIWAEIGASIYMQPPSKRRIL
jgi:hypothetical protein